YHPPLENYRFAIVQLTCVENKEGSTVAEGMEAEARTWLSRYPIPVMVTAFSADGDIYSLDGVRPSDKLFAWDEYPATEPILKWRIVSDAELPDIATAISSRGFSLQYPIALAATSMTRPKATGKRRASAGGLCLSGGCRSGG